MLSCVMYWVHNNFVWLCFIRCLWRGREGEGERKWDVSHVYCTCISMLECPRTVLSAMVNECSSKVDLAVLKINACCNHRTYMCACRHFVCRLVAHLVNYNGHELELQCIWITVLWIIIGGLILPVVGAFSNISSYVFSWLCTRRWECSLTS